MAAMRHAFKHACKFGPGKASRLPRDALDEICGRMMSSFDDNEIFDKQDCIDADMLHLDDDHLKDFILGDVDRHRQGAFFGRPSMI